MRAFGGTASQCTPTPDFHPDRNLYWVAGSGGWGKVPLGTFLALFVFQPRSGWNRGAAVRPVQDQGLWQGPVTSSLAMYDFVMDSNRISNI